MPGPMPRQRSTGLGFALIVNRFELRQSKARPKQSRTGRSLAVYRNQVGSKNVTRMIATAVPLLTPPSVIPVLQVQT